MPKREIERKRKLLKGLASHLEKKLLKNGYTLKTEFQEDDTYFSRQDVDYMRSMECLRVRKRTNFAEITYKPSSTHQTVITGNIVAKQELNVQLLDEKTAETAISLLKIIGLVPLVTVQKQRKTFINKSIPDSLVVIDTIINLGSFVEVEIMSSNTTAAVMLLENIERSLDIDDLPIEGAPYRDLIMHLEGLN